MNNIDFFLPILSTKPLKHFSNRVRETLKAVKQIEFGHTAPGKSLLFFHFYSEGERDRSFACRRGVEQHGLEKKKHHLPGRNSSESKTIVNVTQSQSCRLAVICGPLLPIPIHSVRMEFLDCFSSTLRLRENQTKIRLPSQALSFKKGPLSSGRLYEGGV